ncbi:hypothetical protein [Rhodocista pekingensis]|uniref:Uncharacterized protein n=1 Tax=Rhodocista pekingensis TaxID=201185 RepID=A0ABW2KSR8_9PROT
MTVVTKAGLAAELGISKARVSQYLNRGLPCRPDGKIDREAALNWIGDNIVPTVGRLNARSAAVRSRPVAPQPRPTAAPQAEGAAAGTSAGAMKGWVLLSPDGVRVPVEDVPPVAQSVALKEFFMAELRRREVQVHDRDHIPRADVEAATDAAINEFRGQFEGFAGLLSNMLSGKSPAEMYATIQEEVRRVLARLSAQLHAAAAGMAAAETEAKGG